VTVPETTSRWRKPDYPYDRYANIERITIQLIPRAKYRYVVLYGDTLHMSNGTIKPVLRRYECQSKPMARKFLVQRGFMPYDDLSDSYSILRSLGKQRSNLTGSRRE